ncbi:MAG: sulfotransferase [Myxococcota bacterium]
MSADDMLEEARRLTRIDLVDEAAREPLNILIDSYNRDACLSEEGAEGKHEYIVRFLKNRLRALRDFAAHPEIRDIELKPSVIINAMPRTGSTKMQKVLAATGEFNWLPMWMAFNPASWTGEPNEDVTPRIEDTQKFIDWFSARSPDANAAHAMDALEPEEDSYVMMHSLMSRTMSGYANASSYLEWFAAQDQSLQFEYVVDTLKYLVWQGLADPTKPFVLKSAMSIGAEDGLMKAHGAPHLIMTHRHPREFIASTCKLGVVFQLPFSDARGDFSMVVPGTAMLADEHLDFRKRRPEVGILDIDYRRLRDGAVAVVEEVLAFAGIEPRSDAIARVRQWETDNPKNRHGSFNYGLEDFGLDEQTVDEAFGDLNALAHSKGIDY